MSEPVPSTSEENQPMARARIPRPSPDPVTNLMIADIVLRGASKLLRRDVEKRVARATSETEGRARDAMDGHTLIKTVALYGASRLATRSPAGLGVVVGGLILKALYDRGKAIEQRKALVKHDKG